MVALLTGGSFAGAGSRKTWLHPWPPACKGSACLWPPVMDPPQRGCCKGAGCVGGSPGPKFRRYCTVKGLGSHDTGFPLTFACMHGYWARLVRENVIWGRSMVQYRHSQSRNKCFGIPITSESLWSLWSVSVSQSSRGKWSKARQHACDDFLYGIWVVFSLVNSSSCSPRGAGYRLRTHLRETGSCTAREPPV